MKSIWITALDKNQQTVQSLISIAAKYGLAADGHFWTDDLAKMAWLAVKKQLSKTSINLWLIVGQESELSPEIRYGLSLLCIAMQQERADLPVLWLDPSAKMAKDCLPGIFSNTSLLPLTSNTLGAKLAAMANIPAKKQGNLYRLQVHANPGFGVWLEVGPAKGDGWQGAMLGLNQGEIKAHGVGVSGRIPERCILEYPMKGMELQRGEERYIAWGIQNILTDNDSYYVKVEGSVKTFIFGPLPTGDEAEIHVLRV